MPCFRGWSWVVLVGSLGCMTQLGDAGDEGDEVPPFELFDDDGDDPLGLDEGPQDDEIVHDLDLEALRDEEVEDLYEYALADEGLEDPEIPDGAGGGGRRPRSEWVYWDHGRLRYRRNDRGDRIPDFSHAGYEGGGVRLPSGASAPVVEVHARPGDDTRRIQDAIDEAATYPRRESGIKAVVLLRAGTYQVRGGYENRGRRDGTHIVLDRSGVVLRGEGAGPDGTTIEVTRTGGVDRDAGAAHQRHGIEIVGGRAQEVEGSRQRIQGRVATGSRRVPVRRPGDFRVGQSVMVERNVNRAWIEAIGMDHCSRRHTDHDRSDHAGTTCLPSGMHWESWTRNDSKRMRFDRVVAAIDEEAGELVLDAPITMAIENRFGGGWVYRYRARRVHHVGVENLRGVSAVDPSRHPDQHAFHFINVRHAENAWIRDVVARKFARSLVTIGNGTKWMTVQDSHFRDPVSEVSGGRRYPFDIDGGQQILVQRCTAAEGRHSFVTGSNTMGPNVFLQCDARDSRSSSEAHSDFSTGLLYDNVTDFADMARTVTKQRGITLHNESRWLTTDHGWGAGNSVMWNVRATRIRVESPRTAPNYCIGCRAGVTGGDGEWDRRGNFVRPNSLYLAQLRDRLGRAAIENIR